MTKTAFALRATILLLPAAWLISTAHALPPRAQLAVELNYTRTAKLKSRLGPENYEHTDSLFVLKARFETLADTMPPQDYEKWPNYITVPSEGARIVYTAAYDAVVEVDKPVGAGAPKRTEHHYASVNDRLKMEDVQFQCRSGHPVSPDLGAELEFKIPMKGSSSGVPAGLKPEDSAAATRYSTLVNRDEEGLHCPVRFNLLPPPGPRPRPDNLTGDFLPKAYDTALALSWATAAVPAWGAPSLNWVGTKTSPGPEGLPSITLNETKRWPEEGGEIVETLSVTIRPVPLKLTAQQPPAEMDDATRTAHENDLLRNAKKILGKTQKASEGYVLLLKYLENKQPDMLASDREMIAADVVAKLVGKKILQESEE